MNTISTATTNVNNNNNQQATYEFEKLQKEKASLESHLVAYKLKYAENSSKILELEDEKDNLNKKIDGLNDRMKNKEDIIKNLINERDSLKYHNINLTKKNSNSERLNIDSHRLKSMKSIYSTVHSPERDNPNITFKHSKTKTENNMYISTDASSNIHIDHPNNAKTPKSGFVKIIKNIFTSDKKSEKNIDK